MKRLPYPSWMPSILHPTAAALSVFLMDAQFGRKTSPVWDGEVSRQRKKGQTPVQFSKKILHTDSIRKLLNLQITKIFPPKATTSAKVHFSI
jgi:hypothetical protein